MKFVEPLPGGLPIPDKAYDPTTVRRGRLTRADDQDLAATLAGTFAGVLVRLTGTDRVMDGSVVGMRVGSPDAPWPLLVATVDGYCWVVFRADRRPWIERDDLDQPGPLFTQPSFEVFGWYVGFVEKSMPNADEAIATPMALPMIFQMSERQDAQ